MLFHEIPSLFAIHLYLFISNGAKRYKLILIDLIMIIQSKLTANSQQQTTLPSKMPQNFKLYKPNTSKPPPSTSLPQKSPPPQITTTPFQFPQQPPHINFSCTNCTQTLSKLTTLKKTNILLQYQNTKLIQQMEWKEEQINNLKKKLTEEISCKLNDLGSNQLYLTVKQDLQSEIFQCKYINQLLMMSTQSKKQDYPITQKLQQTLITNLKLQEQLTQKNNIINDHVLYPIYHYDSRIHNLREALHYFYRLAKKQCKRITEFVKNIKKQLTNTKCWVREQLDQIVKKYLQSNANISNAHDKISSMIKSTQYPQITTKTKKQNHPKNKSHSNQFSISPQQNIKNNQNKKQNQQTIHKKNYKILRLCSTNKVTEII